MDAVQLRSDMRSPSPSDWGKHVHSNSLPSLSREEATASPPVLPPSPPSILLYLSFLAPHTSFYLSCLPSRLLPACHPSFRALLPTRPHIPVRLMRRIVGSNPWAKMIKVVHPLGIICTPAYLRPGFTCRSSLRIYYKLSRLPSFYKTPKRQIHTWMMAMQKA